MKGDSDLNLNAGQSFRWVAFENPSHLRPQVVDPVTPNRAIRGLDKHLVR
jgi:hypothetical protein